MNEVEKHPTDEVCNVCGEEQVINEYGRKSCDNYSCPAHRHSTEIQWNSTDEEIAEWRSGSSEGETGVNEYEVKIRNGKNTTMVRVEAKRFEIEGGALVFHEDEDKLGNLSEMTADTKVRAFNNWDEVERL